MTFCHDCNTKTNDIYVTFVRLNKSRNALSYYSVQFFNKIPSKIQCLSSDTPLKTMKTYLTPSKSIVVSRNTLVTNSKIILAVGKLPSLCYSKILFVITKKVNFLHEINIYHTINKYFL